MNLLDDSVPVLPPFRDKQVIISLANTDRSINQSSLMGLANVENQ